MHQSILGGVSHACVTISCGTIRLYHLINWLNWLATRLGMEMHKNISKITRACPTQPCYMASVQVTVPTTDAGGEAEEAGAYVYTVFINSNRDTTVDHDTETRAPCL